MLIILDSQIHDARVYSPSFKLLSNEVYKLDKLGLGLLPEMNSNTRNDLFMS